MAEADLGPLIWVSTFFGTENDIFTHPKASGINSYHGNSRWQFS